MIVVWIIVGVVVAVFLFMVIRSIRGVNYWKRCETEFVEMTSSGHTTEEALLAISMKRYPELSIDTHKLIVNKFNDLPLLVNFFEGALTSTRLNDESALKILRYTTIQRMGPNRYKVKTESARENTADKKTELEETFDILDEATYKFGASFDLVREQIEEMLRSNKEQFLNVVREGRDVRKFIYSTIANISGDMVESGQYHIYRGVLNPTGPGGELLRIFDAAIDELVRMGDTDTTNAEKQKKAIRENIKSVG